MLTFGEFISVISLCIACFTLGYRIGHDRSSDEKKSEQE